MILMVLASAASPSLAVSIVSASRRDSENDLREACAALEAREAARAREAEARAREVEVRVRAELERKIIEEETSQLKKDAESQSRSLMNMSDKTPSRRYKRQRIGALPEDRVDGRSDFGAHARDELGVLILLRSQLKSNCFLNRGGSLIVIRIGIKISSSSQVYEQGLCGDVIDTSSLL
ncbi:hypothetical protein VNO78_14412 [Psophocarpus tetragonolobus]|uniref:Uncharacterized protein n=1 Tax=Psophocarpus tetragonolobus TaxID=3891 RepID=A0AAN9XR12_PSOTE